MKVKVDVQRMLEQKIRKRLFPGWVHEGATATSGCPPPDIV